MQKSDRMDDMHIPQMLSTNKEFGGDKSSSYRGGEVEQFLKARTASKKGFTDQLFHPTSSPPRIVNGIAASKSTIGKLPKIPAMPNKQYSSK